MEINYNIDKQDVHSMIVLIQFLNYKLNKLCDKDTIECMNKEMLETLNNYVTDLNKLIINMPSKTYLNNINLINE